MISRFRRITCQSIISRLHRKIVSAFKFPGDCVLIKQQQCVKNVLFDFVPFISLIKSTERDRNLTTNQLEGRDVFLITKLE